jgi:hypothetical protein
VAAVIKDRTGIEPELVEGGRGEFSVWVREQVVAKKGSRGFPAETEVLAAVEQALAGG